MSGEEQQGLAGLESPAVDVDSAVAEIVGGLVPADAPVGASSIEEPAASEVSSTPAPSAEPPALADGAGQSDTPAPESTPSVDDPAPDAWTGASKAAWAALPPEIRAEIRKREGDFAKGIGQYKQAAEFGHGMVKMLEPFRDTFTRAGTTPAQIIPRAVQAYSVMAFGTPEDKVALFTALAGDAGIDLTQLAAGGTAAATSEIAQLKQRLQQLEGGVTSVAQSMQSARMGELEKSVNSFAADETKHPYFWDVAMDMKRLLETGVVGDMDSAYDMAVWQNPVTRAKEVDRELGVRRAREAKEAQERAEKARKAAAANVRATGTAGRASSPPRSLDDTLSETWAEIQSRAH